MLAFVGQRYTIIEKACRIGKQWIKLVSYNGVVHSGDRKITKNG